MWREMWVIWGSGAQPDHLVFLPILSPRLHFHSLTVWIPMASSPTAYSGMPQDTWMGTMLRYHVGAMGGPPGFEGLVLPEGRKDPALT